MVKIIVQWYLVISLGVAGLRTYLTLWVNCTFIWENIRIHGSKCYLLLRHTELKRLISTGFGTSLIQIKKLCIVFWNSQNRDAQMLFARIPKSMTKLAKRWGRQRKRKRKRKREKNEEKLIVFWIARESSVSDAFSKFLSKYSYISLRRLCNFH